MSHQNSSKDSDIKKCPVDHSRSAAQPSVSEAPHERPSCPIDHSQKPPSFAQSLFGSRDSSGNSGCPVDHSGPGKDAINPLNMMPNLTQNMHADQTESLSTERELSSIPRATGGDANSENVWEYPSPQQFYNALARKNMAAPEEYMDVMVDIHNFLNEGVWNEVLKWESRHRDTCMKPKLLRLQGRPNDLSPLARISGWLHGVRPFDRHDWYVDRCGKQVRYVIDYYEGNPVDDMPVFNLVVRPAVDDFGSLTDRAKQLWDDAKVKYFGDNKDQKS